MYLVCVCFFVLSSCAAIAVWNPVLCKYLFFAVALFLGVGFGTMFPAFNTLFVNLAPNGQRGTATSTYLTSWDVGIGAGLMAGAAVGMMMPYGRDPMKTQVGKSIHKLGVAVDHAVDSIVSEMR